MRPEGMKVGELARRTGVSVRTLHHYDALGLLVPSRHTEAGYRLYGEEEIARLQQIVSLRQLGFALEEIRECLNQGNFAPERLIDLHLTHLRQQIARQTEVCTRLEAIARCLRSREQVSAETFLQVIERMNMTEKYYTAEQQEWLKQRRGTVGEERIREVEAEWPRLMAEVRNEMDKGTDPADPKVQALAQRWRGLVQEFTGGNPGIEKSLQTMYENESPQDIHPSHDPRMAEYGAYIGKAMAAAKQAE